MFNRNYYPYRTNFGDVSIYNTDFIVRDVNVEQKHLQKMVVPINTMLFLISEEHESYTYAFIETDYTTFATREKIESIQYGYPANNHDWCCYAETKSFYIVLPNVKFIKKRVAQMSGIFNIIN